MIELGFGIAGLALSLLTYLLGIRSGKRTERAIRSDLASVPQLTADVVGSIFESVANPPKPDDPDRGWTSQYSATFGFAPILPYADENALLVEFPYGAHSAALLALDDDFSAEDSRNRLSLRGAVMNGTGARFHVREASDGTGHEVVTLDYVRPLRDDRSLAAMPTQAVYYRLTPTGFVEVGRGDIYDSVESAWDIPRAVEPFLDPDWVQQQRA